MKTSAGLLMYKKTPKGLQFLLAHPGGPFWKNKDFGAWGIPKGGVEEGEEIFEAAKREFFEETGIKSQGEFIELGFVKQTHKTVHAWAFEGDFSGFRVRQSTIKIEFPPKSGKIIEVPEVDKISFFNLEQAKQKIIPAQFCFLEKLNEKLSSCS